MLRSKIQILKCPQKSRTLQCLRLIATHDFDDFFIGLLHALGDHGAEIINGFFNIGRHNPLTCHTVAGQSKEASLISRLSSRMHFHGASGFCAVTNHTRRITDDIINRHAALFKGTGIKVNKEKMDFNLKNSLMLATAFTPVIGYDKCSEAVKLAFKENISLKEAVLKLNLLPADYFLP